MCILYAAPFRLERNSAGAKHGNAGCYRSIATYATPGISTWTHLREQGTQHDVLEHPVMAGLRGVRMMIQEADDLPSNTVPCVLELPYALR